MSATLSIVILADSQDLSASLEQHLRGDRYICRYFSHKEEFIPHIEAHQHEIDCLVLSFDANILPIANHLYENSIVLPAVIIKDCSDDRYNVTTGDDSCTDLVDSPACNYIYQPSEVVLGLNCLEDLGTAIESAIAKFLNLTPIVQPREVPPVQIEVLTDVSRINFLLQQQRRLADKLKERLGYLAIYYKRNPKQFYRHLDRANQQELLHQLQTLYREIVLQYFSTDSQTNAIVDEFVSLAFFADLSVSEIVKIHMELMEEFSKQLKLEGRSEEILLDYRLTLIDIIAHLCEMYRRSIPREM